MDIQRPGSQVHAPVRASARRLDPARLPGDALLWRSAGEELCMTRGCGQRQGRFLVQL